MARLEIYQVDAFTDSLFGGNPAGIVLNAAGLSDDVMQKIAREMNLSETAFVSDNRQSGDGDFKVRFFTPLSEVDLCGHATIGTFWLLAELGLISGDSNDTRVIQHTKAGPLPVDVEFGCEGGPSRVMMSQNPPEVLAELTSEETAELETILGAPKGSVTGFDGARPQIVSTGLPDLIAPLMSREALLSMRPNMQALTDFSNAGKIISVHCFSLETVHPASTVHCRDFSPAVGVPEESATGTASGATGAYLVLNNLINVSEPVTKIVCEQGHILKRPSVIHVEVMSKNGNIEGVKVGGGAVTIMKGSMKIS